MASAAKKAKTSSSSDDDDTLPECPYGASCYRRNPQHFKEYHHPPKPKDGVTAKSTTTGKRDVDPDALPPCKFGANCYRKNLLHYAEFSHPTSVDTGKGKGKGKNAKKDDSGSDTDKYDSDDNDKDKNSILKRGMSLVKSYSKMSEGERKELIKKAFEVKQKLQEELKETKEKMAQKEKELVKLQEEVNTGFLLVDGEKEALEGTETKYFKLHAERAYREGSADQIHFRLAESQFYRLLSGPYSQTFRVTMVEYVVNPDLVKHFKEAREDLKKFRGEKMSYPVLAFHGTSQQIIPKICEGGFLVPGEKGFKHKTDTGWYGKGVYFSEYPGYSMGYIQDCTNLLLCQVLPGKSYQCTKLIHGASLMSGYDSHTSPDKKELVVFNSLHILPCYIVHYDSAKTEFKYAKGTTLGVSTDIKDKMNKASIAPATKVFKGYLIQCSGTFCDSGTTQTKLIKLAVDHGATAGKATNFTILVSTEGDVNYGTGKVARARKLGFKIVNEEFVYDCILQKKFLKTEGYEL